eukprot:SAG31_NODE_1106_length_9878_cov_4.621331_15_plen_85_part_00
MAQTINGFPIVLSSKSPPPSRYVLPYCPTQAPTYPRSLYSRLTPPRRALSCLATFWVELLVVVVLGLIRTTRLFLQLYYRYIYG